MSLYAIVASVLVAISLLSLSWWSLEVWQRHKQSFFIASALVSLAAGGVIYFTLHQAPVLWPAGVVVTLVVDIFTFGPALQRVGAAHRPWIIWYNIIASMLCVGAVIGVTTFQQYQALTHTTKEVATPQRAFTQHINDLDQAVNQAAGTLSTTSLDLDLQLRQLQITSQLDSLFYVDTNGVITHRAEDPTATGGTAWQLLPALTPKGKVTAEHGIAHLASGQPIIFSAVPRPDGSELIAIQYLTSSLLHQIANGAWGVADRSGIIPAEPNNISPALWQSADLDTLLRDKIASSESTPYRAQLQSDLGIYHLSSIALPTVDSTPVTLVTLSNG